MATLRLGMHRSLKAQILGGIVTARKDRMDLAFNVAIGSNVQQVN